ncbi:MAG: tetratricopeptide repeat protein [Bacteroidota bacterium]
MSKYVLIFSVGFLVLAAACQKEKSEEQEQTLEVTAYPEINELSQAIVANPNDANLYAQRAAMYYDVDGYDNAIADLKKAIALDSTQVDFYHLLADSYMDYFRSRLALETMEEAAKLFPDNDYTLLKLSEFQMILTKNQESLKTIDKVLRRDPRNSEAYFMMGMNFKDMGDTIRAINSFQEAVDYNSNMVDGWLQLGNLYTAIGDKLALNYYDNAIRVAPENIETHHAKAYYLANTLDDLDGALEIYKTINKLDPQYEEAYYNAGLLYLDLEKPQEAHQQFDLAIKFSPTHIRAYFYRGLCNEFMGNIVAAKKDYEQALRMAPDYEAAQKQLDGLGKES